MGLSKYKLGDLIQESLRKNDDLIFDVSFVRGISNNKQIVETKATVDDNVIRKFYIVNPGEFVYNPRTTRMGDKLGLAYNDTATPLLFSFNNIAFGIRASAKDTILPEYLYMFFNRTEFDRYAMAHGWGSATELFSFDEMCNVKIQLPDISVQRKYVAVYNAMLANQQSYERGLEDLKLTCDAYIEELRRNIPSVAIGKYLIPSDERNTLNLSADSVRGLSVSKDMIETKANMNGVSVSNYKIVPPRYIAYVSDTSRRGDKMSLGFNRTKETFLVSSISTVFKTDTRYLLPEFLMLYICRDEFDRYARFHSWGSARETFDWDEMCDVRIPIPAIEIQQDIVNIYEAYLTRKEINEKLKTQIKNLCPILIKGSIEEAQG